MQRIPWAYIVQFSNAIEEIDKQAKIKLNAYLKQVDLSDPKRAREHIAEIMERVVGASDAMAATMAAGFYDGIREHQLGEKMGALAESGREPESTKNATYGITSRLEKADEPDISLVEGLLAQRVGYEIKRSVGRTMYRNGERDKRKPKFARIPVGGDSCEFCRMLASRGFAYNSERSAGKHNPDHYHDRCRCEVVCSWENDPRIAGMSEEDYNDRAWGEYGGDAKSYASKDHSQHKANQAAKRRNRYTDDGKLKAGYSGLRIDKQDVYTADDRKKTAVRAAAQRGNTQRGATRRNFASTVGYEGSFGDSTAATRNEYEGNSDKIALFNRRNKANLEMEGSFDGFSDATLSSIFSGIEYGGTFVGTVPSRVKLISTEKINKGVLAQVERRAGDDVIIRVSSAKLRKLTPAEVEQVVFHEMAHTVEYRFTSFKQYLRETDRLIAFRDGGTEKLRIPASSKVALEALQEAGVAAVYSEQYGKILFVGDSLAMVRKLPEYAYRNADLGTQDSELIAECIRFVALHGYGKNLIADTIAKAMLGG